MQSLLYIGALAFIAYAGYVFYGAFCNLSGVIQ